MNTQAWRICREEAEHLEQCFLLSCTIPGTRSITALFLAVSSNKVRVAYYSSSTTFREEKVTLGSNELPIESITGFVTCSSEHKWWLACVIKTIPIRSCVQLTFLHPHGPLSSFKYLAHEDIMHNCLRQCFGTRRSKNQVWSHLPYCVKHWTF